MRSQHSMEENSPGRLDMFSPEAGYVRPGPYMSGQRLDTFG
jgi:hypothetical protein